MKKVQVFKNAAQRANIEAWYDKFLQKLPYTPAVRRIDTRFGWTEVLDTMPESTQTPIILFHGAMSGAPFALGEILEYPRKQRMIAVNIMGQSPRAAELRLDFKSDEYGQWFRELLRAFGLEKVILTGVSWGGSIAIHVARTAPETIAGLILCVPGSLVKGSDWQAFKKVGLPMIRYKMRPTPENLRKAFAAIFTTEDPFWSPYMGEAMQAYNVDFSVPPLVKATDMQSFVAPVYVISAENDIYFPGQKVQDAARAVFPNYVGGHILPGAHHTPSFSEERRREFVHLYEKAVGAVQHHLEQAAD